MKKRKSPYFVDVGCGNGFLTYLLTSEGYRGCGIDLQKRKIWECYEIDVDLRQSSVDPSDLRFPDAGTIEMLFSERFYACITIALLLQATVCLHLKACML